MNHKYNQIILHVGMHKTGTTSIQSNCHRLHEVLAQHNIIFPHFFYQGKTRVNHSGPLTALVCESPDRYGEQWRFGLSNDPLVLQKAYRAQFEEILTAGQNKTLILSGETVSAFQESHLEQLRDHLLPYTDNLRVLVYLRSPASALASTLQQRIRDGSDKDSRRNLISLAGTSRRRIVRLREVFADRLEVINFHDAAEHKAGLVASFLTRCGLTDTAATSMEYAKANRSMPSESFRIMLAINKRYPAVSSVDKSRLRKFNDLRPVSLLPGRPFQLDDFKGPKILRAIEEETFWLEEEFGLNFETANGLRSEPGDLWSQPVLLELEQAIRDLENPAHQIAAAEFLLEEAERISDSHPNKSLVLKFISDKLVKVKSDSTSTALKRIGADYFKSAALHVEESNPALALDLMTLAHGIRPEGVAIQQRIEKYKKILGK